MKFYKKPSKKVLKVVKITNKHENQQQQREAAKKITKQNFSQKRVATGGVCNKVSRRKQTRKLRFRFNFRDFDEKMDRKS